MDARVALFSQIMTHAMMTRSETDRAVGPAAVVLAASLLLLSLKAGVAWPEAPAQTTADPLAMFDMDGQQIIQRAEHVGIVNGKLTVGIRYPEVASLSGLWAPPYVSSDFMLESRVDGKPMPTTKWMWRPFQVEREGNAGQVSVSTVTTLIYGHRAAVVSFTFHNTGGDVVPLELTALGTLDSVQEWGFAQPRSTTQPTLQVDGRRLTLRQGPHVIVLALDSAGWSWEVSANRGRAVAVLPAKQSSSVNVVIAIGPSDEAALSVDQIVDDPLGAVTAAREDYARRVRQLLDRLPSLESDNAQLVQWYNRSLVHLLMNRWDVPEFVLQPYYSTGSVCGGCVTEYLWNYGEAWQLLPFYDPAAHRQHITQFLQCDMTAHFAFNPVDGQRTGHGTWSTRRSSSGLWTST